MVGVPNTWLVDNGAFTSQYEAPQYKQSLDIVAGLRNAGVMSPDAFSSTANFKQQFGSGSSALVNDGWVAWSSYVQIYGSTNPDFALAGVILPKWNGGGQAGAYLGRGMYTFTALKKTKDKARIRELLSILNWFAAPFGSQEYLFLRYGLPMRDYTLQGSDPVPTDTGASEVGKMVLSLLASGPQVIYNPGQEQSTKDLYRVQERLSAATVAYPTAGLFSSTDLTKGAAINKKITDLQLGILQGRKPLSAWDDGVKAWRDGGGDQIRAEYEQAYAAANG
jgi:putative aldouronate transport system substrate-binding protein